MKPINQIKSKLASFNSVQLYKFVRASCAEIFVEFTFLYISNHYKFCFVFTSLCWDTSCRLYFILNNLINFSIANDLDISEHLQINSKHSCTQTYTFLMSNPCLKFASDSCSVFFRRLFLVFTHTVVL